MKYTINGTWVNDDTVKSLPAGAVELSDVAWVNRQNIPFLPSLQEAKEKQWEAIKTHRDYISGHSVSVGANWFHSDTKSRLQQVGLVMMGASLPVGLQWKKLDGVFITMTPTLAGQIFQTTAMRDQAVFAVAETHRVAMEASADPANYDFSGGWPAIYTA